LHLITRHTLQKLQLEPHKPRPVEGSIFLRQLARQVQAARYATTLRQCRKSAAVAPRASQATPFLVAVETLDTGARSRGGGQSPRISDENFLLCGGWRELKKAAKRAVGEIERGSEHVPHEWESETAQDEICSVILGSQVP
jgi:hypothetical protein